MTALEAAAQRGPITHYVRYLEPKERGLPDLRGELPCDSLAQAHLVARSAKDKGKRDVQILSKEERDQTEAQAKEGRQHG